MFLRIVFVGLFIKAMWVHNIRYKNAGTNCTWFGSWLNTCHDEVHFRNVTDTLCVSRIEKKQFCTVTAKFPRLSISGTRQNSVDSLAFETLIPKSIVQRYISLLMEHRRIILCGPSGTGKTYLAQKLAEHLVLRSVISLEKQCCFILGIHT